MEKKLYSIKVGDKVIKCQTDSVINVDNQKPTTTIEDCLKFLGIHDHYDRIYNSHSKGSLRHLGDYYSICLYIYNNNIDVKSFTVWFNDLIEDANNNMKRPISIYQHVYDFFMDEVKDLK